MNDSQPKPPNHQRLLEKAMAHSAHGATGHGSGPAAQPAPSIADLKEHFPDYEILELIGRGGMGSVFKAVQRNLQRTVAIKVLAQELAGDPEVGERFLREAQTLATLNHPGILTVHDYGERDGVFFLVTEFVDGVNLRQLMELGELSPAEALRIAPQLCIALQFAHERGVVHRDIKPENILIDTQGQVKIADFGLAKVARPGDAVGLTRNTAVLGTPHYMAPEQWQGARLVDHRADIYSLGVVIYEMLTGNLPLGNFDPPSQRGGVPHGLDAVVRRALAQQPENRYQHAREVQSDVERQASNLKDSGAEAAANQHPAHSPDATLVKGPVLALLTLVSAVVAIGYLVFLRQQDMRDAFRFESNLRTYHSIAYRAAERAKAGQPVDDMAVMPTPPEPSFMTSDAVPIAALSIGVGTLLLILAIGFASVRRIRNSNGHQRGLLAAVITAWLVPFGIAVALLSTLLSTIRSNDLQVVLGIALMSGAAYGAARFVIWEVARHRRLMREGVRMQAGGGWIATAFTLAIAAWANVAAAPRYLPSPDSQETTVRGPVFPQDLIGQSRAFVIQHLGPPLSMSVGQSTEMWGYKNHKDDLSSEAIVFAGDRVVSCDEASVVLRANEQDTSAPHIGQPLAVFVAHYGQPTDRVEGSMGTQFTFANGVKVSVRNGIVFARHRN